MARGDWHCEYRGSLSKFVLMNTPLRLGLIGMALVLLLNIAGIFVFQQGAALFFSNGWWSTWFPVHIVWLVFLFVGLARYFSARS